MKTQIALYAHPRRQPEAERLARRFNLPLGAGLGKSAYTLVLTPERLELRDNRPGAPGPVFADFTGGRSRHRRLFGGGKNQPLARAAGIRGDVRPAVVDATAGLGRDAFVLATLGCRVTLVERSPVLAALLADALERAELGQDTADIAARMHLVFADARDYLPALPPQERPDTVYLDPMYPHRSKSALVKKEMRFARELAGDDADAPALLAVALHGAARRVAVKRPAGAEPLAGPEPAGCVRSPNTRYDIYPTGGAHE